MKSVSRVLLLGLILPGTAVAKLGIFNRARSSSTSMRTGPTISNVNGDAVIGIVGKTNNKTSDRVESLIDIEDTKSEILEPSVRCTLYSTHYLPFPGKPAIKSKFHCMTDSGRSIITNVPEDFFKLHTFQSGKTRVTVHASGMVQSAPDLKLDSVSQHGVIDLNAGSGMIVTDASEERDTFPIEFSIAVVRVSDKHDHSPDNTVAEISNYIFGTGGAPLNLVAGYQACSGNKVNFRQATGAQFSGGVMDLELTENISNVMAEVVEDHIKNELEKKGINLLDSYTHVMYVLPQEVSFRGALAYGYQGGQIAVFWNTWVSQQWVRMHEFGHNIGFHHSGEDSLEYGDDTCMMGAKMRKENEQRACFNGAKSWQSGWYSDHHNEVTPTLKPMDFKLTSIDDYVNGQANSKDQYTVARIEGSNEANLFVMYNRASGINYQVRGHKNEVTIVQQETVQGQSWLNATLGVEKGATSRWTKSNWNKSGKDLVIELCEREVGPPDYAHVLVYLEGVNDLSCGVKPFTTTCGSGNSKLKIGVLTDNWGDETTWWLKENNNGVYDTVRSRSMQLPNNLYSEKEICIDNKKCYKFKIRDEGQDGICCGEQGDGWYTLTVNDQIKRHSKFEGLTSEVTTFGVDAGVCN